MDRDTEHPRPTEAPDERAMFRALVDHSSELVVVTDHIGTIRYASPAASLVLGYGVNDHEGKNVIELVHPDEVDNAVASLASTAGDEGVKEPVEIRLEQADGTYRSFEIIATNLLDDPDVRGIVFHGRDLTDRLEQQRRFRMLFEQSPIASAFIDFERGVFANVAMCDLVGYSREELLGIAIGEIIVAEDFHRGRAEMTRRFESGHEAATNETRWVRKDGSQFWGRTTARVLFDDRKQPESLFIAVTDITSERESLAALRDSERRYRAIIDNSTDIIAVLEPDGHWTASDAGTRQLGYPKGFDPDGGVFSLVHPDELGMAAEALAEVLDGSRGPMDPLMLRLRDVEGNYHHYECVGQNLGNDADVGGVVITARNVDRRHALEERLASEATHDALTGLLNRAALMGAIERAFVHRTRTARPVGLMFIDLDRFKQVNDTLGHNAGDVVLVEVARRITQCVRGTDHVARLGGDEFVVLCEDLDSNERAMQIAERIVQAVEERVAIEDREAFVGASVGIAFAQEGQSASDLLRDADAAVYRAKREGRARVERFDDAMRADTAARVSLEVELRHALERNDITAEYEPVVSVTGGVIESFIVRPAWQPQHAPAIRGRDLRTLADEAGVGRLLGQRTFELAAADLAHWSVADLHGTAVRLFVTPPPRHLLDREFANDLHVLLGDNLIAPHALCIGVPEEWLVDDTGGTTAALDRLHELGTRVAITGFGRSHSSLADLRRMPLDIIRLDPKFAFGLAVDPAGAAIVNAVVGLARALEMRVLVDGVNEADHLAAIFTLGCDLANGEVFAPPVDGATAARLLGEPIEASATFQPG